MCAKSKFAPTCLTEDALNTGERQSKILLVEDHELIRNGLKSLLSKMSGYSICGEAETAPRALELVAKYTPDLAIVDITLRSANGLELTKDIRALSPKTRVLIFSAHGENVYAERALRAGAMGYIMKDEPSETIVTAVETILRNEVFISEKLKRKLLQRFVHRPPDAASPPIERLSDREMEVLRFIGNGYGTREIAQTLNLSVKTIDSYREHLKEKFSFSNSGDLLRYAIQWTRSDTV